MDRAAAFQGINGVPLTLADALSGLSRQAAAYLAAQQTAPDRFDTGAVIRADWGVDDPGGTAGLVALSLWTHLLRELHPALVGAEPDNATLAYRALLALSYLERVQRPSGLTDLRDCNYDSSPDAGFILQAIVPPLLLARNTAPALSSEWAEVTVRLTEFARKMVEGAKTGGFHTPNHRWVIAAALHLAQQLFPDMSGLDTTIEAYLVEGIDIDEDGFYIERSAGVYDAICARSLYILADCPSAKSLNLDSVVARNLLANTHLLNFDGTIETGLSRRQDAGTAPLAASLAVPYLLAHFRRPIPNGEKAPLFLGIAQALWELTPPERRDYYGMSQALLRYGVPKPVTSPSPLTAFSTRYFPANGLWRMRRGSLSVSVFRDQPRLLDFRFGAAFLAGVSIHQSYFGVGQFLADVVEVSDSGEIVLISTGTRHPSRPGYDQPLGRPVPPELWQEIRGEREVRRVPPAASRLTITPAGNSLSVRFQTTDGLDRVTSQIAFDFAAGGVWETGDTCFEPQPGQTIFLKKGEAAMRYGRDVITIGPGADAHRMTKMRDEVPAAPGLTRVLMTFVTPIDHTFTLAAGTV